MSKHYLYDPPKKSKENKAPRTVNREGYYLDHRGLPVRLNGIPLTIKQVQNLGSDFQKRLMELARGEHDTELGRRLRNKG